MISDRFSFAQLQEDEKLTDDQLNLEFDSILKNGKYSISNKKFNFGQEKKKVDDLNRRIDQSTEILESLEKSISQGLYAILCIVSYKSKFSLILIHF